MNKLLVTIVMLYCGYSFSQEILNVNAKQENKQIIITYDIISFKTDQDFDVSVKMSENQGKTWNEITELSGDVGKGIIGGKNKKIIWVYERNYNYIVGKYIEFNVFAKTTTELGDSSILKSNNNLLIGEIDTITDKRDKNKYRYIKFNSQKWLSENVKYETNQGSWYYGNDTTNFNKIGKLYSWEQAKNACPDGWHLPSKSEWFTLIEILKHYNPDNVKAYLVHPDYLNIKYGGWRYNFGAYFGVNQETGFWTSDELDKDKAIGIGVYKKFTEISDLKYNKNSGFYVRCIND